MLMKRILTFLLVATFAGLMSVGLLYIYLQPQLPDVTSLKDVQLSTPLKIYSQDGKLLSQFGEKRRVPLTIDEIPQALIDAFIATEDSRFYQHNGVDPIGIVRAAAVLLVTGKKSQGASTITMQVARNFFLSREKTYIRKIKEIFVALRIEKELSKEEILELYLNRSFFGNRAYGVGAAAEVYYGKTITELSLAEMAMIAGLPQSPSVANPIRNPERAMKRRNVVLLRMLDMKYILPEIYEKTIQVPITASYHDTHVDFYAPYVAEMARNYLVEKLGADAAYTGGYSIYTTIDSKMQRDAQNAVLQNIYDYDERHGYRGAQDQLWSKGSTAWSSDQIIEYLSDIPEEGELVAAVVTQVGNQDVQIIDANGRKRTLSWKNLVWARKHISATRQGSVPTAANQILTSGDLIWIRLNSDKAWQLSQKPEVSSALVSLDPYDGSIKALVGGVNFHQSQYNRAIQAQRQVGSTIKPFLYAAALEKDYTLATLVNNAPINEWDKRQGIAWRPKNSPDVYTGPTRFRLGLGQSINVMSVRIMRHVGIDNAIKELMKFGFIEEDLPRNESIALGSGSITPLALARAYAVFANQGYLIDPYFIHYITDADGKTIMQSIPRNACDSCYENLKDLETADANMPIKFSVHGLCPIPREYLATRVIDQKITFLMTEAMKGVIWGGGNWSKNTGWTGTGWRAARVVRRRDIAGKTGTTNEAKDTWFAGFNPDLVTTVWVGFDDSQQRLGYSTAHPKFPDKIYGAESGAKTAGPAWNGYMKHALKKFPLRRMEMPKGMVEVRIDRDTGLLTTETDENARFEYFIEGTEPTEQAAEDRVRGNYEEHESETPELFE